MSREFLRHTLATLAYRGAKTVRGAPPGFGEFRVSPTSRTPGEILAHIGDLLDWALTMAKGDEKWHDASVLPLEQQAERFHRTLAALDAYLASDAPLARPVEHLFQGPIADALTHVGQIAMLRRAFGAPMKGENYSRADIVAGRVGAEQTPAKREFD